MVFGRSVTYATFAVLAAAFVVAAVLVAAPAWSQDTQTKEDTSPLKEAKTGDTKTPEKPAQAEKKESGSGDAEQAAAEKSTTQTQKKESVSKAAGGVTTAEKKGAGRKVWQEEEICADARERVGPRSSQG